MYDSRPTEPTEFEGPEECPVCKQPNFDDATDEPLFEDEIHCCWQCRDHTEHGSYSWRGVDYASYEGDEYDGVYYSVGEGPDGWYLSTVVDSDTGSFCMGMDEDDGPYATAEEAMTAGKYAALDWCFTNEVIPGE